MFGEFYFGESYYGGGENLVEVIPTPVKNPTQWRPESGFGSVVLTGSLSIATKAGLLVANKAGFIIVENPSEVVPKNATIWTGSGV